MTDGSTINRDIRHLENAVNLLVEGVLRGGESKDRGELLAVIDALRRATADWEENLPITQTAIIIPLEHLRPSDIAALKAVLDTITSEAEDAQDVSDYTKAHETLCELETELIGEDPPG